MLFNLDVAVFFPSLRPELAPADVRGAALFLNPGIGSPLEEETVRFFRPVDPPMDPAAVRMALAQFESLGEGVKTPRDLETLRSMLRSDFYSETSSVIMAELTDRMIPGRPEASRKRLIKAQTLLCLAWVLEERVMELRGLSDGLEKTWNAFGETLGLDEDDAVRESALPGEGFTPRVAFENDFRIPWTAVLEAMLAFLPPDRPLFLTDATIAETWMDRGLGLEQTDPASLERVFRDAAVPSGLLHVGTYPGYRLALSNRPSADKPWLDAPRTVIVRSPLEA